VTGMTREIMQNGEIEAARSRERRQDRSRGR
jgi:hypothetical protein